MPLYEYHCEKCNQDFEVRHGIDAPQVTEHINCKIEGVNKVFRIISTSALHFKGSGFYSTDYKNK